MTAALKKWVGGTAAAHTSSDVSGLRSYVVTKAFLNDAWKGLTSKKVLILCIIYLLILEMYNLKFKEKNTIISIEFLYR